jgi:hypothetical protein
MQPSATRNVKDGGAVCDGQHDDTHAIQAVLSASHAKSPGGTITRVMIPDNCVSGHVAIGSDSWIEFAEGATLHALPGGLPKDSDSLLYMTGQNITIKGHNATIAMNRDEYTSGEGRAGVYIGQGSKNITIDDLKVTGAGGDGFTVAGIPAPDNVQLINVSADRCQRNGISIITGTNIKVQHATLTNTSPNGHGAATRGPYAGIDVEPNGVRGETLDGITLQDIHTAHNAGAGLQFALHVLPQVNITVSGLHSDHDGEAGGNGLHYGGIFFIHGEVPPNPVPGKIHIENVQITSPGGSGILWRNWHGNSVPITLRNVTIDNPGSVGSGNMNKCGLYYNVGDNSYGSKYPPGKQLNATIEGLTVRDDHNRMIRSVWLQGDAGHPLQVSVKGVNEETKPASAAMIKER